MMEQRATCIRQQGCWLHRTMIAVVLFYLSIILFLPLAALLFQAFSKGIVPFVQLLFQEDVRHALVLTLGIALGAVGARG